MAEEWEQVESVDPTGDRTQDHLPVVAMTGPKNIKSVKKNFIWFLWDYKFG